MDIVVALVVCRSFTERGVPLRNCRSFLGAASDANEARQARRVNQISRKAHEVLFR